MFTRVLDVKAALKKNSFFLFGARGTGKSTWVKQSLPEALIFDLLDSDVYERLLRRPRQLEEEIPPSASEIVIDEIQRLPALLNSVHRLIENRKLRFALTGSSARSLRAKGTNLLGGRAWDLRFCPLAQFETEDGPLLRLMNHGGLPKIYLSQSLDDADAHLSAYLSLYLQQEIKAEAVTRKLDAFVRFLDTMGLQNGKELHFQAISNDSGVPARTVENYLQILDDTLLGFVVLPFQKTQRRKAISRAKFYFFDLGLARTLARIGEIKEGSENFGNAFEHFILLETRAARLARRRTFSIAYWRTKNGFEVDFIINDKIALEVKATTQVQKEDLRGLKALREEGLLEAYWLVSRDPIAREVDGIQLIPWQRYVADLWASAPPGGGT